MTKISAEQFSKEGDKYIGRSYDKMDCQEFYEQCLKDAGIKMNLRGSNKWYREFLQKGWVGSPEECVRKFGSVPKGTTLFIHAYDGGEEKVGYHDGLGNASHIGIKTGRGKGAIHSSYTKQCVAESAFHDETIKDGWNIVGLHPMFTYGEKIDRILEGNGGGSDAGSETEKQEESIMGRARLEGGNTGKHIHIRKNPDGDVLENVPQGTDVELLGKENGWYKVLFTSHGREYTGYVMEKFVVSEDDESIADDSHIPAEDPADFYDEGDDDGKGMVTLSFSVTAEQAAYMLPALEKLVQEIVNKVGRG